MLKKICSALELCSTCAIFTVPAKQICVYCMYCNKEHVLNKAIVFMTCSVKKQYGTAQPRNWLLAGYFEASLPKIITNLTILSEHLLLDLSYEHRRSLTCAKLNVLVWRKLLIFNEVLHEAIWWTPQMWPSKSEWILDHFSSLSVALLQCHYRMIMPLLWEDEDKWTPPPMHTKHAIAMEHCWLS